MIANLSFDPFPITQKKHSQNSNPAVQFGLAPGNDKKNVAPLW